jgi:hypothetical protein
MRGRISMTAAHYLPMLICAAVLVLACSTSLTVIARLAWRPRSYQQSKSSRQRVQRQQRQSDDALLPYARQPLLTAAERAFFDVLTAAAPHDWHIFAQVRLANLVQITPGTPDWQRHFNRIQAKCVDFVLCEPHGLVPQLVVELDDSSHQRTDRKARDAFVDDVLAVAGLPILHVPWQRSYDAGQLAARINAALGAPGSSITTSSPKQMMTATVTASCSAQIPVQPQVVARSCRRCHEPASSLAKFCKNCGASVVP